MAKTKIGTQLSMTLEGAMPERVAEDLVLEHRDHDPVGGRRREQVERDRLDRDHDRVEDDQQQQE